jgi:N-glycosylase/DNA lyase
MSVLPIPLPRIERAIREVCHAFEQQNSHASRWEDMSDEELWREIAACILGSRVPFQVAYGAVERMDRANLFSQIGLSMDYDKYEQDLFYVLAGSEGIGCGGRSPRRYPFPKIRAKQIRASIEKLCAPNRTIRELLDDAQDVREARRNLASEVVGLGPKQASLFLRNIGYSSDVAVLDIHVLTYMHWIGLTADPMKSVRTLRQYEALEDALIEYSRPFGVRADCFDVAVWVVVKVAKEESRTCH